MFSRPSISCSRSAWASVRGNPSRMNPPRQRMQALLSRTHSQTVLSDTSSPRLMDSRAAAICWGLLAFAPATGGAEGIAGREVAGPQPLLQELRLGALADTGSAKENQPP